VDSTSRDEKVFSEQLLWQRLGRKTGDTADCVTGRALRTRFTYQKRPFIWGSKLKK
jgi:hypothetical protein